MPVCMLCFQFKLKELKMILTLVFAALHPAVSIVFFVVFCGFFVAVAMTKDMLMMWVHAFFL